MKVQNFRIADASFERSPGQGGGVFVSNLVDERHGAPVTIGYGRYDPHEGLTETMAVDDVMIILEGSLVITSDGASITAGPGDIVHMPKGESVTIVAQDRGATTAYVTFPHWREAR